MTVKDVYSTGLALPCYETASSLQFEFVPVSPHTDTNVIHMLPLGSGLVQHGIRVVDVDVYTMP